LLFIISVLCLYTLFWVLIQVIGLGPLKRFTAWSASSLLEFTGIENTVEVYNSTPFIVLSDVIVGGVHGVGDLWAAVTDLCVGDIELALLPAIILSTFDRSIRKRIVGVVSGILLIILINPIRIFIVIWSGSRFGWSIAEFMHSFTFRLTLILVILGFYYVWYLKYNSIHRKLQATWEYVKTKLGELRNTKTHL